MIHLLVWLFRFCLKTNKFLWSWLIVCLEIAAYSWKFIVILYCDVCLLFRERGNHQQEIDETHIPLHNIPWFHLTEHEQINDLINGSPCLKPHSGVILTYAFTLMMIEDQERYTHHLSINVTSYNFVLEDNRGRPFRALSCTVLLCSSIFRP